MTWYLNMHDTGDAPSPLNPKSETAHDRSENHCGHPHCSPMDNRPTFIWLLALLVFFSALAIRFPEPWAIVGARYALIHIVLALTAGIYLPFLLRGRIFTTFLALGIGLLAFALPIVLEAARGFQIVLVTIHLAAVMVYAGHFLPPTLRERVTGVFAAACIVVFAGGLLASIPSRQPETPSMEKGPFEPSDARTMTGGLLKISVINNSKLCAGCHASIYEEWTQSMHGSADLEDPFYMPAHDLMDAFYGKIEPGRYCSACHNPGMLLSGAMVTPPNPNAYERLRDAMQVPDSARNEGVSCLACHAQAGSDLRGNGSYIMTHPQQAWHLFGGGRLGNALERIAIESRPDWHRLAMRPANLGRAEFCASCHTQTVDERLNNFGFLKIRSEYEEWFGHYTGGQGTNADALTCRDCHMPFVTGSDAANNRGKHRSHRFLGAHTALPKVLGFTEQVRLTEKWLRGEYFPEELHNRWPEGPLIAIHGAGSHEPNAGRLSVGLTNVKVGHSFPAGTITFADVWVEIVVRDATGAILFEDGVLQADGTHSAAFRLFGTLKDEQGKRLTMAQTFQAVGMGERHTIMPGYTDTFHYRFDAHGPRPWIAQAKLHYRKVTPSFQAFALPNEDIRLPIVLMNETTIVFDAEPPVAR
jgi:hypothetical protein